MTPSRAPTTGSSAAAIDAIVRRCRTARRHQLNHGRSDDQADDRRHDRQEPRPRDGHQHRDGETGGHREHGDLEPAREIGAEDRPHERDRQEARGHGGREPRPTRVSGSAPRKNSAHDAPPSRERRREPFRSQSRPERTSSAIRAGPRSRRGRGRRATASQNRVASVERRAERQAGAGQLPSRIHEGPRAEICPSGGTRRNPRAPSPRAPPPTRARGAAEPGAATARSAAPETRGDDAVLAQDRADGRENESGRQIRRRVPTRRSARRRAPRPRPERRSGRRAG